MEAHSPYRPPPEYRSVSKADYHYPNAIEVAFTDQHDDIDADTIKTAYDDAVSYLAAQYRDIHATLEERYDVVITCGDHGELFGGGNADGLWGHFHGVYEPLTHVPLVISGDGIQDARIEDAVSLRNVYDTVLAAASIADGAVNLRDSTGDSPVLTESHGISNISRLEGEARQRAEVYDEHRSGIALNGYYGYETPSGWSETGTPPEEDPQEILKETQDGLMETSAATHDELSDSLEEQLEKLGYK